MDISLQLYTVRDKTQKDMPAALREVAAIGYRWVELAGFGSCKGATELRKALEDAGLRVSGMHVGPDVLGKDADKALDEAAVLGSAHVICPWVPVEQRSDADAWKRLAAMLNAVGLKSQKRGIQLSYHNHDFEFVRLGEKMAYDLLLETADSACLKMELDVYWVKKAGLDPVGMVKSLGSRLSILHLKDMEPSPEGRFAPVGEGILDFPSILAEGRRLNVAFGCVEMDSTYGRPTMECAKAAFDNLKRLGA